MSAISAVFAIAIVIMGISLRGNMLLAIPGLVMVSLLPLVVVVQSLKVPIGIEISEKGVEVFFRRKKTLMILWKNVISMKLVNKDLNRYILRATKDDGEVARLGLSEEPAEEVKVMWSRLFPNGRNLSDDAHIRYPSS
jgi:hypothetical protein